MRFLDLPQIARLTRAASSALDERCSFSILIGRPTRARSFVVFTRHSLLAGYCISNRHNPGIRKYVLYARAKNQPMNDNFVLDTRSCVMVKVKSWTSDLNLQNHASLNRFQRLAATRQRLSSSLKSSDGLARPAVYTVALSPCTRWWTPIRASGISGICGAATIAKNNTPCVRALCTRIRGLSFAIGPMRSGERARQRRAYPLSKLSGNARLATSRRCFL